MAKFDIYEEITNRIIVELDKGNVPWLKPWSNTGKSDSIRFGSAIRPINGASKRPYTGLNILLLWLTAEDKGYTSNKWYTFKGVNKLGGSVKKGEKSTLVYFMKDYTKHVEKDNGEVEDEKRWVARGYRVFNHEQTTLPPE